MDDDDVATRAPQKLSQIEYWDMKLKTEPTPPEVAAPVRIILRGSLSKAEQTTINKAGLRRSGIADSLVPAATEQADPVQSSNSLQLMTQNKKTQDQGSRG